MVLEGGVLLEDDPQVLDLGDLLDSRSIRGVVLFLLNGKLPKSNMLGFIRVNHHLVIFHPLVYLG